MSKKRVVRIEENYRDGMDALTIRPEDGGLEVAYTFHDKADLKVMMEHFQYKMLKLQDLGYEVIFKEKLERVW